MNARPRYVTIHHDATVSAEQLAVDRLAVSVYTIPTDHFESDGTFAWTSTTMVLVEVRAGHETGLGYSYTHRAAGSLIEHTLSEIVLGRRALDVAGAWDAMLRAIRNIGRPGVASSAIAAVDIALWDLKARLLGVPLAGLLGAVREAVPVYGSGGFTSYSIPQLCRQLEGWVRQGIPRVKMKVGTDPREDPERVSSARNAIGPDAELFVDANGAYDRKRALAFAERFAESGVSWFEEPVTSDDLDGLRLMRDRAPAGMDIAAGEYGYDLWYFRHMLDRGAVDVLQADATRCAGITGFMRAGTLCEARSLPFSAHTAPSVHAHPACALPALRHVEYFHDHARIEHMLFDGALEPQRGELRPDWDRPGLGLTLKRADAARFAIH